MKLSRRIRWFLFTALYLAVNPPLWAETVTVEAFTDNGQLPIQALSKPGLTVTLYDLSAPRHIEQELSAGLPNNPEAAAKVASQFIQANQETLAQRLMMAYQSHTKAMDYGLTHYPALVFNGQAVIYGVTDVLDGLNRYETWLETQNRCCK
jgi:integrating conjugative element protein (TIGR03757 family)